MIEVLLQAERLLVHGMVDQAEDMFRRVAEQDPQNAIAVVGLARVALERGDDHLAYEKALAALEIDRQNFAALRLEARLSEVFATRGAPVDRPPWLDSGQLPPPAPPAPPLAEPATPAADTGRPSERFVLTHNPTMADHRRRTEEADRADRPATPPDSPTQPTPQRSGLLRRLLGRKA